MAIKSLSRNTLITLVGYGTLLGAFLLLGYLPYWSQSRRILAEIAQRQEAMAQSVQQTEQLKNLTCRAQLLQIEVHDYNRLVPENKDLGTFLGQLSGDLDASGMQNTAVRALTPTISGKVQQLPIEVRGTGTFQQFQNFLVRLENLPRMSSVSRLNIEADNAMTGKVTIELTLSIYNTITKM